MNAPKATRDARIAFFLSMQGGPEGAKSRANAEALADAEARMLALGWTWDAEPDPDGTLGDHAEWCADAKSGARHSHEILGLVLRDQGGRVLGSLWSIIDPDNNYLRLIAAELASEEIRSPGFCPKSADGKHAIGNVILLGDPSAKPNRVGVTCLHCGARGVARVTAENADWRAPPAQLDPRCPRCGGPPHLFTDDVCPVLGLG